MMEYNSFFNVSLEATQQGKMLTFFSDQTSSYKSMTNKSSLIILLIQILPMESNFSSGMIYPLEFYVIFSYSSFDVY